LLYLAGRFAECKSLLIHALELCRKREDDFGVVRTLRALSDANRLLGHFKEGIQQAKEVLEICERLDDIFEQGHCFRSLAGSLYCDDQLDAAETAASQAIDLLSGKGDQSLVCQCHRILGKIYHSRGEMEKAIDHFETTFKIASSFNWDDEQFWTHYALARVFLDKDRSDDAHAHIERAKPYMANVTYRLGRAMGLRGEVWYRQRRLKEAQSELLGAAQIFENLGATRELWDYGGLLRAVEEEIEELGATGESDPNATGEFLETMLLPARTNFPSSSGNRMIPSTVVSISFRCILLQDTTILSSFHSLTSLLPPSASPYYPRPFTQINSYPLTRCSPFLCFLHPFVSHCVPRELTVTFDSQLCKRSRSSFRPLQIYTPTEQHRRDLSLSHGRSPRR